eukprot:CAMPEP_0206158330 /NCGR_PEP_ID=MMETSP1474-20131121/4742_1 /ASSEMBLY_ACC=CAM_ASM_001110 /TAXON_ID=97495 /ORGANISM="Imantonia sp., Strain RCC918" /LENGTH=105 /DNA_ID=CAMNT_0053558343 /DNA_START=378 /DNA_END=692 /DNA_ORIENTATION=+
MRIAVLPPSLSAMTTVYSTRRSGVRAPTANSSSVSWWSAKRAVPEPWSRMCPCSGTSVWPSASASGSWCSPPNTSALSPGNLTRAKSSTSCESSSVCFACSVFEW